MAFRCEETVSWGAWVAQLVSIWLLILAHVMIPGLWDPAPHRAEPYFLLWAWSLLETLSPSALPHPFKLKKKWKKKVFLWKLPFQCSGLYGGPIVYMVFCIMYSYGMEIIILLCHVAVVRIRWEGLKVLHSVLIWHTEMLKEWQW